VMVNVGEGTQRLCKEHGHSIAKIDHIVVTDLTPDEVGGVVGAKRGLDTTLR
jgi:ribonuclease BN (tRNA processing enzyme)